MIQDYKSRFEARDFSHHRRPPRLALLALISLGLGLGATGIYASFQMLDDDQPTASISDTPNIATAPETISLALPIPKRSPSRPTAESEPKVTASLEQPSQPVLESLPQAMQKNAVEPTTQTAEEVVSGDEPSENRLSNEAASQTEAPATNPPIGHWLEEKVKRGDSLARIFSRLKLSPALLHKIVNSSKQAKSLAQIRPGETLKVHLDDDNNLLELVLEYNPVKRLQILPAGDGYQARIIERELEVRVASAAGTITDSLYQSAQRAGLSDALVMELANIFGWDIDFALEIRAGDRFSLLYEEAYLEGKKYRNGPILAAEFVNRGKVFKAVRYEDEKGYASYFTPDGKSMRKAFLRAPVDFRRISSRFRKARYHPVLGRKRPHRGVDYAAAPGTPIKASGDGRVIFRGRKGGYGKTIIIQHGSQYRTLYAHMSRFNRKVKQGSRVRQGQIIGYVGSSGLATGPHLHYEFRVNGVHRNPLTIKLPAAKPIAKRYRADFQQKSQPLLARLALVSETKLSEAEQAQQ